MHDFRLRQNFNFFRHVPMPTSNGQWKSKKVQSTRVLMRIKLEKLKIWPDCPYGSPLLMPIIRGWRISRKLALRMFAFNVQRAVTNVIQMAVPSISKYSINVLSPVAKWLSNRPPERLGPSSGFSLARVGTLSLGLWKSTFTSLPTSKLEVTLHLL